MNTNDSVKEYYGKVLQSSGDLQTNACCTATDTPHHLKQLLANIHPEVAARYYGCGLVRPDLLLGMRVLDLGSGSGRDCYLLSQLVGEQGYVLGVDMTEEQLAVADRHLEWHRQKFGFAKSNVEFRKGYIEHLDQLGLEENSFDIIVSNCVINLSPDKEAVLREAYRLLKPGGELYFSDVYADRRVPAELVKDKVLYGECLSGALYWNDFLNLAKRAGFPDPRLVEDRPLAIENQQILVRIGHIAFFSATYRLFKLDGLESHCEDYGQAVVYRGGIAHAEHRFQLDKHHLLEKGRIFPVCGNSYRMLHESRFNPYFDFFGNTDTHYGIFEGCGSTLPFDKTVQQPASGGCC
ncbi:MAG: methyltransferase domain-containing protein [Chromatiaceae bacterium]|nr:methyltransferase domain-containing protein [Gammaproteobacteria bacterium]MCB1870775.1 methyltransferase domain-containing protein [Gammaproteobacteria bacterium]MCP5448198.1 methyltransferase domain-containing protein [Chromatiaceae bacterium]